MLKIFILPVTILLVMVGMLSIAVTSPDAQRPTPTPADTHLVLPFLTEPLPRTATCHDFSIALQPYQRAVAFGLVNRTPNYQCSDIGANILVTWSWQHVPQPGADASHSPTDDHDRSPPRIHRNDNDAPPGGYTLFTEPEFIPEPGSSYAIAWFGNFHNPNDIEVEVYGIGNTTVFTCPGTSGIIGDFEPVPANYTIVSSDDCDDFINTDATEHT